MSKNKKSDDKTKRRQKADSRYCKLLAKANNVPESVVDLLKKVDDRYCEIQELLWQVEENVGIANLENDIGQTFSQLALNYASQKGCMPYEELICILGRFCGPADKNGSERENNT